MRTLPSICYPIVGDSEKIKFEARIYEKAEHWEFDRHVDAESEEKARQLLLREYPRSQYIVKSIHRA